MSPWSSSRVSRGTLPRKVSSAAVSVPSSGMKEVLRANGRRLAMGGRMRLRGPSTIATGAYRAAPALSGPYTMSAVTRPLVANAPERESSTRPCQFIRDQGRAILPPSGRLQVLGRRLTGLAVGNDFEGDLLAFL